MAEPDFTSIDYLEEARERVTYQFKEKEVFDKYIQLVIEQQTQLQNVFKDLLQKRSIDTATGVNLDIIGEIVGQPRELISADLFTFFGFEGALGADTFGNGLNSILGGKFFNFGDATGGNVLLDDETYRLFIKAKILKNTTASTPEEFISFVNYLFGTESTFVAEGQAEYTVFFGRPLTAFEQVLLNYVSTSAGFTSRLIPKTVGVRVNFGYFTDGEYFGFQGAPGAKGFGDLGTANGSYGYGLGYGLNYGDSDYTTDGYYIWEPTYVNGEYDGGDVYSSVKTFVPNTTTVSYVWEPSLDGELNHDGTNDHTATLVRIFEDAGYEGGGIFATLI